MFSFPLALFFFLAPPKSELPPCGSFLLLLLPIDSLLRLPIIRRVLVPPGLFQQRKIQNQTISWTLVTPARRRRSMRSLPASAGLGGLGGFSGGTRVAALHQAHL